MPAQQLKTPPHSVVDNSSGATDASSATAAPQTRYDVSPGCAFCFGSGMEVVSGKGARRCRCRTEQQQTGLLKAARIPCRYSACSLINYYPDKNNGAQLRAFNYAYRLVDHYPAIERGLLFMGTV